jgi:hypothetical protein
MSVYYKCPRCKKPGNGKVCHFCGYVWGETK